MEHPEVQGIIDRIVHRAGDRQPWLGFAFREELSKALTERDEARDMLQELQERVG